MQSHEIFIYEDMLTMFWSVNNESSEIFHRDFFFPAGWGKERGGGGSVDNNIYLQPLVILVLALGNIPNEKFDLI